jgi:hypothetical protein
MTNALTILLSAGAYAEICRRAGARGEPAERYLAEIVESMVAPAAMAAELYGGGRRGRGRRRRCHRSAGGRR